MEILDLIDTLEELVVQARRLPVGGNLVVDRKRVLDVVDQLRLAVPDSIRQAGQIIETRDHVIQEAHESARAIVLRAEEERARRVDESAVVREAQERSQAMIIAAENRARETIGEADATAAAHMSEAAEAATKQMDDADDYTREILRRLEKQLQAFLESIRMSASTLDEKR